MVIEEKEVYGQVYPLWSLLNAAHHILLRKFICVVLGMVAHACNLRSSGGLGKRIQVGGQPGQQSETV